MVEVLVTVMTMFRTCGQRAEILGSTVQNVVVVMVGVLVTVITM